MSVISASKIFMTAIDLINVIDSVVKLNRVPDNDDSLLEQASVVNRLAMFGFSVAEAYLLFTGSRSERLLRLKSFEMLPRTLNIPIQMFVELKYLDPARSETIQGAVSFFATGILVPFVDMLRVSAQRDAYNEKHFLEMPPEQLEKADRPIYEIDADGRVRIIGYKPVDLEECKMNLGASESLASTTAAIRGLSEGCRAIFGTGESFYISLARFFRIQQHPRAEAPAVEVNLAEAPAVEVELAEEAARLNFLAFTKIPFPLHGDDVFRRFVCPIAQEPIRDPVYDPNGVTLYEREAIRRWIQVRPISPITRSPLSERELLEAPAVRAVIDHRLQFHRDRMLAALAEALVAPVVDPAHRAVLERHG